MKNTRNDYFVDITDVEKITGCARAKGYRIIKQLNEELAAKGIMTIPGLTPRKYFFARFGIEEHTARKEGRPKNDSTEIPP